MSSCRLTRRHLLLAGAAALGGPVQAQGTPPLVLATYGGLWEKILREKVIPGFVKEHPATVQLELGVGSTFIPKMVASRRRAPYTVVSVNDDEAFLGESLGLWAPDQSSKLRNIGNVYDHLKPPALPLYASTVYEFPLVYNPNKMPKPKSWSDLWRPGITVAVPHISDSYGITFLYIAALLNGGGEKNLGPGFDALKRLPNMKIFKGVTQGYTMFQQGEVDAGLLHSNRARQLKDAGVDIAWITPEEGVWGQRTGTQLPKNSLDPELGLAWIDYSLGLAAEGAFADSLYTPTNRKVEMAPELAAKHIPPDRIDKIRFVPWQDINPQRNDLLRRWTEEFA